jgi:hypothetical protein
MNKLVCFCKNVSENGVRNAVINGAKSVKEIGEELVPARGFNAKYLILKGDVAQMTYFIFKMGIRLIRKINGNVVRFEIHTV